MLRFKLHHLFAYSLLVTALCHRPAQAMGLNFDLDVKTEIATTSQPSVSNTNDLALSSPELVPSTKDFKPLPIPPAASQPPVRITQSSSHLPNNVIASARVLTPPPPTALPTSRILEPINRSPQQAPIALSFIPDEDTALSAAASLPQHPDSSENAQPQENTALPAWIYEGGSDSLVARVIGSAEGTRTASGHRTQAYYGHTDPGNGVWNMGTFSYQHGAHSPQEADQKQLRRLKTQGKTIVQQADQADLTMSLGEVLNGLDLANQSPRAALERGGYVDRLAQARQKGMHNNDAIIWARTYSYLDPDTQRWNAPGLGNTLTSIRRDQSRRHDAVAQAFNHYQAQNFNTDQPPEKTLDTPILALAQPPLDALPSEAQDHSEQEIDSIEPVSSMSLAFNVNEPFHSAAQDGKNTQEPIPSTRESQAEVSQLDTQEPIPSTRESQAEVSQLEINDYEPEETSQIHVSSDRAHGTPPDIEVDNIPG